MTYFKELKPGHPLPPRPEDFSHKLVRVYPGTVQTAYRDEKGGDGGSSFSVSCDPRRGVAETVGVSRQAEGAPTQPERWSPTRLYLFSETPLSWRRSAIPEAVRSTYDAACSEAQGFIGESLEPFQEAVRDRRVSPRPLGALSQIERPDVKNLVEEFDFYAQETGRLLEGRVGPEQVVTVSFREGGRFYTGVDLNHDGILDVLSVHDESADRDLLIYDLERAPALVKSLVARVKVPKAELDLLPVAARFGGEACRSSTTSHVPFPDYVTPEAPASSAPLRGLLDFYLEPMEAINPLCARDIFLTIKFYTTGQVNDAGRHRFRVVTDLDSFFRAQEEAVKTGREMPSQLPDASWITDAEARFPIPHPPLGRLWRIDSLTSPVPTVHWTTDHGGYVEIMLESISADGTTESHPFKFLFTADEGQGITFLR